MKPASVSRLMAACHRTENEGLRITTDALAVRYEPLRRTQSTATYNRSVPVQTVEYLEKQLAAVLK